jgi:hypothetical protein
MPSRKVLNAASADTAGAGTEGREVEDFVVGVGRARGGGFTGPCAFAVVVGAATLRAGALCVCVVAATGFSVALLLRAGGYESGVGCCVGCGTRGGDVRCCGGVAGLGCAACSWRGGGTGLCSSVRDVVGERGGAACCGSVAVGSAGLGASGS